jgi:hypothetical protein
VSKPCGGHAPRLDVGVAVASGDGEDHPRAMLTVNSCIEVRLDLQADKSSIVVKGPFFPRVVNPRYRIRGTNV